MTPVPQNSTALRSKYVVNNQYVDLSISAGTEIDMIHYTAFLVQLQPKTATQTYAETAGMSVLTHNSHYATAPGPLGTDSGYGAYMNTSQFKIIKRLEFESAGSPPIGYVGNPGTATGNIGSGTNSWYVKRCQFKVPYGNTVLKSSGQQTSGLTLKYDQIAPEHKRFIVIFSTNSLLDGKMPECAMSCLTTGYALE